MDPAVLRDQLTKLHEELRAAPRVDPASSRLLGELLQDIRQLMARTEANDAQLAGAAAPADAAPGKPAVGTSLPDRLERIAVLFEVDHPALAASSRRLVDLLGKVGL